MLQGRTLLKPLKVEKVSKPIWIEDEEKNKDLKPGETRESKLVKRKVAANYQYAEVVATSEQQKGFVAGDVVIFKPNNSITLDLIKDVILVMDYDIIAKKVE